MMTQIISAAEQTSTGFVKPVIGGVTSPFGMRNGSMHEGVDYGAPLGAPIAASRAGKVTRAEWFGGYGNCVDISHGGGLLTRYAHMSKILTSEGTQVSQGQKIGLVGSTGDSTGPHLHFEIRINGVAKNPVPYVKGTASFSPAADMSPLGIDLPENVTNFLKNIGDTKYWLRMLMYLIGVVLVGIAIVVVVRDGVK